MNKILIAVILASMGFAALLFSGISSADTIYPSTLFIGFEKNGISLYDRATNVDFTMDNDGYVFFLGRISTSERSAPIFGVFDEEMFGEFIRLGLEGHKFTNEYAENDYSQYEFKNGPFIGLGLKSRMSNDNVRLDVSFSVDFGQFGEFRDLHDRSGFYHPESGTGSWNANEMKITLAYMLSNVSCFIGIDSYFFNSGMLFTDYVIDPDLEVNSACHVAQPGFFGGMEFMLTKSAQAGFSLLIPPGGGSGLGGYRIYVSYGL